MIEAQLKGEFQLNYFSDELLTWLTLNADLTSMRLNNQAILPIFTNKLIIYQSLIAQKVDSYEMILEASKLLKTEIDAVL